MPIVFRSFSARWMCILLAEGTHRRLYEKLGAHPITLAGTDGVVFALWAPNAQPVSVVGDFNGWDGRRHPMRKRHEAGVWELFIPNVHTRRLLQIRDRRYRRNAACR